MLFRSDRSYDEPHQSCSNYEGDLNVLCKNLESLKHELHRDSGLGMKNIITDKLKPHSSPIPKEDLEKYIQGLRILYKTGKYSRDYIIKVKEELDNFSRVHEDDKWHHVNKLNTNYSDLAEFLTKMISESYGQEEIETINSLFLTQGLGQVIRYLKTLIKPLVGSIEKFQIEDLKSFTKNTQKNTKIGEISEDMAVDFLKPSIRSNRGSHVPKGLEILYRGGNGDFIDMKFGVDIILNSEEGIKLIQVKSSENFSPSTIRPEIDWVCIANRYGVVFYDNRNLSGRIIVNYKGVPLCEGVYCES